MLAQNQMISTEYQIEGKTFEEVKKEDSGVFAEPYTDYRWKTTIKPVKFPNMQLGTEEKNTEATQDQIMKMMSEYLSRSIHEIQVRIFWKKGSTEQDYTISTFWVNFQNEISF